jgi:hypothetical protein
MVENQAFVILAKVDQTVQLNKSLYCKAYLCGF